MQVHKVKVEKGVITELLNTQESDLTNCSVKYIASLQVPQVGDRVYKYFGYTSMLECKGVILRYYQELAV